MINMISKASTFNKILIFIVVSVSIIVAIVLFLENTKKETLKTEAYYRQDIKELGTTLRKCDEMIRDDKTMNDIQIANCKTARSLHTEYVFKALYDE